MKKLSIIIVNWNTKELTLQCLDSFMNNIDNEQVDVYVVDNASKDGSAEAFKSHYPLAKVIENKENRGFAAANNQVLEQLDTEFALLLNSDTLVIDDAIKQSLRYIEEKPEIGVFGCKVLNPDKTLQISCSMFPSIVNMLLQLTTLDKFDSIPFFGRYHMKSWDRSYAREVDVISGCFFMIRKEVIDKVGAFDADFWFFGEETDLCQRISKAGWKIVFAPVGEIIHYGSVSARKLNYKRDLLLTSAIIRLHKKHKGKLSALVILMILTSFSLTRYLGYGFISLITFGKKGRERFSHFYRVLLGAKQTWTGNIQL